MIGTTIRHFQIERRLGAGGMGEVYVARDLKLDRPVALKFIHSNLAHDPEMRRRFEREARALAAVDHPCIGAVYDVEEADGRLFLVLAYIEGRTLDEVLAQGPLAPARARAILLGIAEGLHAAHRHGIVHRDIKCSNVIVSRDDDLPKIVDFGIALREGESRLTESGAYAGTTGFIAPEVYRGSPATTRSDVFSLGVVFYQVLTGRRPFDRAHSAAEIHAILNEDPAPFPRDLPPEFLDLGPLVGRCLEKDPARRFADAGEVAQALRSDTMPTLPVAGRKRRARPVPRAAWVVTTVVILGALAGWWAVRRGAAPPAMTGDAARSVAVLEFENVSGDSALNWMKRGVAELLSTALVQSPQLDVFDAQRLGDLAANEGGTSKDRAPTIPFLAQHGIRRAIAGNILHSGGDLRIQGRIVDTGSGRLLHAYEVEGPADSGMFHLVGQLIPQLQVALEVNLTGDREAEGWLREITTTSADAYRLYLRGHQALLASRWKEAAAAYEKALELDSTFIAARTELSGAYWNLGDGPKLQLTRAAMRRLRSRADHRGQLRIDLLESVVGNDPPATIRSAFELAQLYPENRFFTYLVGRGYYFTEQYRRCLDTLEPLMKQRYTWAGTYMMGGRAAAQLGDTVSARRIFELGLEITRDPEVAYAYVGYLTQRGDRDRSRAVLNEALRSPLLGESPMAEGELRLELAKDLIWRGDVARGREELQRAGKLIPPEDEARHEADSLLRHYGLR